MEKKRKSRRRPRFITKFNNVVLFLISGRNVAFSDSSVEATALLLEKKVKT